MSADNRPHVWDDLCPQIAVLSSPDADAVAFKNNLTVPDMLLPFSKFSGPGIIKDPNNPGVNHTIKDLRVEFRDLKRDGFLLPQLIPSLLTNSIRDSKSGSECFSNLCHSYLRWLGSGNEEFLGHYLACLLVVSTAHPDPMQMFLSLSQAQNSLQHGNKNEICPPFVNSPKWFVPNILKYYLLIHDPNTQTDQKGVKEAIDEGQEAGTLTGTSTAGMSGTTSPVTPSTTTTSVVNTTQSSQPSVPPFQQTQATPPPPPQPQPPNSTAIDLEALTSAVADDTSVTAVFKNNGVLATATPADPTITTTVTSGGGGNVTDSVMNSTTTTATNNVGESIPHALSMSNISNASGFPQGDQSVMGGNNVYTTESSRIPDISSPGPVYGQWLSVTDRDHLRVFVEEFLIKGLFPFVERQMKLLNEQVISRSRLGKSIFGFSKKWLPGGGGGSSSSLAGVGGSSTSLSTLASGAGSSGAGAGSGGVDGAGGSVAANASPAHPGFTQESGEMQARRLADLAFLFRHYQLALGLYQNLKRDFANENAWLYHAPAIEMAGVCSYLVGGGTYPKRYTEDALNTYIANGRARALLAARCALLSTHILKELRMLSEAASQFIRMTSGESDVLSGVFLEQASFCFKEVGMSRKYALHMILGGHRYSKSGHRRHALRCYRDAGEVYRGRSWSLAEDHILFTIGQQCVGLQQYDDAIRETVQLLHENSKQYPQQQLQFLNDYLGLLKNSHRGTSSGGGRFELTVPKLDGSNVIFYYGGCPEDWLAYGHHDSSEEFVWQEMEEELVGSGVGKSGGLMTAYRDRKSLDRHEAGEIGIGEWFTISFVLENTLNVPLLVSNLSLEYQLTGVSAESAAVPNSSNDGGEPGSGGSGCGTGALEVGGSVSGEQFWLDPLASRRLQLCLRSPAPSSVGSLISVEAITLTLTPPMQTNQQQQQSSNTANVTSLASHPPASNPAAVSSSASQQSPPPPISTTSFSLTPSITPLTTPANFALSVPARLPLNIQGPRLNKSKQQKMGVFYGADKRMQCQVVGPVPWPQLRLSLRLPNDPLPSTNTANTKQELFENQENVFPSISALSGQFVPLELTANNSGSVTVECLFQQSRWNALIPDTIAAVSSPGSEDERPPAPSNIDPGSLSAKTASDESGSIISLMSHDGHTTENATVSGALTGGLGRKWTLWLSSPELSYGSGSTTGGGVSGSGSSGDSRHTAVSNALTSRFIIPSLFSYASHQGSKLRTIRRKMSVDVEDCLGVNWKRRKGVLMLSMRNLREIQGADIEIVAVGLVSANGRSRITSILSHSNVISLKPGEVENVCLGIEDIFTTEGEEAGEKVRDGDGEWKKSKDQRQKRQRRKHRCSWCHTTSSPFSVGGSGQEQLFPPLENLPAARIPPSAAGGRGQQEDDICIVLWKAKTVPTSPEDGSYWKWVGGSTQVRGSTLLPPPITASPGNVESKSSNQTSVVRAALVCEPTEIRHDFLKDGVCKLNVSLYLWSVNDGILPDGLIDSSIHHSRLDGHNADDQSGTALSVNGRPRQSHPDMPFFFVRVQSVNSGGSVGWGAVPSATTTTTSSTASSPLSPSSAASSMSSVGVGGGCGGIGWLGNTSGIHRVDEGRRTRVDLMACVSRPGVYQLKNNNLSVVASPIKAALYNSGGLHEASASAGGSNKSKQTAAVRSPTHQTPAVVEVPISPITIRVCGVH